MRVLAEDSIGTVNTKFNSSALFSGKVKQGLFERQNSRNRLSVCPFHQPNKGGLSTDFLRQEIMK